MFNYSKISQNNQIRMNYQEGEIHLFHLSFNYFVSCLNVAFEMKQKFCERKVYMQSGSAIFATKKHKRNQRGYNQHVMYQY